MNEKSYSIKFNDYYQEYLSQLTWHQNSNDSIYAFLRNSDSLNQNTNAEVKLYSRNSNGSYSYQTKEREEGVPYGDMVELRSTKNWYSWDDFKAYYYYTWISNGWWTLYSYPY